MFNKETTFILGAGASKPYGYPLSDELISQIEKLMESEVYLPMSYNSSIIRKGGCQSYRYGYVQEVYQLKDFEKILEEITFSEVDEIGEDQDQSESFYSTRNFRFLKIKIKDIDKFKELYDVLSKFNPVSIDSFLRDNPSHSIAGRIMIIFSLLAKEGKMPESKNNDWYRYLLEDILSGCIDNPRKILENKINFITFNYDMSLDSYLYERLQQIELYQEDQLGSGFWDALKKNGIKHVYGQIYSHDDLKEFGLFQEPLDSDIIKEEDVLALNTKRFLKAFKNQSNIKLIHDDRKNIDQSINEIISAAEEIIIIGFSFDRDNLARLGLIGPNQVYLANLFKYKTIKYLNYNGYMTSLPQQFNEIVAANNSIKVIESQATNIAHAYKNDFKRLLY